MLSRDISIRFLLLLGISILIYNMYQYSMGNVQMHQQQETQGLRTIVDKDGNKIPVFDDNTLFPKPGGGYCSMTPIKDIEEYLQAVNIPTAQCKDAQYFGGKMECMDGFKNKNNCVVLSFGVNYNFKFEDVLIDRYGCQGYSFDPTMDMTDHVRKNGKGKYFSLGLSSFKGVKTISYLKKKDIPCKVDRYVNIVNMLGLADKEIDFLKVDIEGSELDFIQDTALNYPELFEKVWQIQLEFHNLEGRSIHSGNLQDTTQLDMMKIVDILKCHGFAMAYSRKNMAPGYQFMYQGKKTPLAYETTWIRV